MVRYGAGAAILIGMFLGVILLSILNISDIIALIVTGFVATYLTAPEEKSYKVGGVAAGMLGVLIFLEGFFTPPAVPYSLPSLLDIDMIMLILGGIVTLVFGFIISGVVSVIMGSIGGLIAEKVFY